MLIPVRIPQDADAEWPELAALIENAIASRGGSPQLVARVTERMLTVWEQGRFSFDLDVAADEQTVSAVVGLHAALKQHLTGMLLDRLLVEIELARALGIQ